MLFALALLFSAAFASGCVEPVPGTSIYDFGIANGVDACAAAIAQFAAGGGCAADLGDYAAFTNQPAGTYIYEACPCSCPDGANSGGDTCTGCDTEVSDLETCMTSCTNGGSDASTCQATTCLVEAGLMTACCAGLDLSTMMPDDEMDYDDYIDLDDCTACADDMADMSACGLDKCMSACMSGDDAECEACVMDKCSGKITDAYKCAYDEGCMPLDTCTACSDEESDLFVCSFESGCGEDDVQCYVDECGSNFDGMNGCAYTNCDNGSYDVWITTKWCGDATSCDSDCTTVTGDGMDFGACNSDDGSWMAVCNDDNTVTVSQYSSYDCSGSATTTDITNGWCGNLEMDGSNKVYKYEWFGGCGGSEYVAPSSTSALFVAVAFILSVILY